MARGGIGADRRRLRAVAEKAANRTLAPGCRLKRDVEKDHVLRYEDVEIPEGRVSDRLRAEQDEKFG